MMQMRVQSASHSSMLCVVSTVQQDLSRVVTCATTAVVGWRRHMYAVMTRRFGPADLLNDVAT